MREMVEGLPLRALRGEPVSVPLGLGLVLVRKGRPRLTSSKVGMMNRRRPEAVEWGIKTAQPWADRDHGLAHCISRYVQYKSVYDGSPAPVLSVLFVQEGLDLDFKFQRVLVLELEWRRVQLCSGGLALASAEHRIMGYLRLVMLNVFQGLLFIHTCSNNAAPNILAFPFIVVLHISQGLIFINYYAYFVFGITTICTNVPNSCP
jgi:hypothetical protein